MTHVLAEALVAERNAVDGELPVGLVAKRDVVEVASEVSRVDTTESELTTVTRG